MDDARFENVSVKAVERTSMTEGTKVVGYYAYGVAYVGTKEEAFMTPAFPTEEEAVDCLSGLLTIARLNFYSAFGMRVPKARPLMAELIQDEHRAANALRGIDTTRPLTLPWVTD